MRLAPVTTGKFKIEMTHSWLQSLCPGLAPANVGLWTSLPGTGLAGKVSLLLWQPRGKLNLAVDVDL